MQNNITARMYELAEKNRVPLVTMIELTWRCNLMCRHCYISEKDRKHSFTEAKELTTRDWKEVISSLASLGCLYLTFSGGEVFLRQDIIELVSFARSLVFSVSLFTNGTLIDENKAIALAQAGISSVEISLYGRQVTHEYVTGLHGSFSRSLKALKFLKGYGINAGIKCPLMTFNFDEYPYLIELCKENGFQYAFDPTVVSGDDGNMAQLAYRASLDKLKLALKDSRLTSPSAGRKEDSGESKNDNVLCSAGRTFISIGPDGTVYPCVGWRKDMGNVKNQSLEYIWQKSQTGRWLENLTLTDFAECAGCRLLAYCPRCPGMADKESGNPLNHSPTCCQLAQLNHELETSVP